MLKVFIEVSQPVQAFDCISANTFYRIKDRNNKLIYLPIPERAKTSFHHQFEHVGTKKFQCNRKHALSKIVGEAYDSACGHISSNATEQLFLPFNNIEMVFYVTPQTKSLFFNWFKNTKKDNYEKERWYVLCALVYYAWLAAKQK